MVRWWRAGLLEKRALRIVAFDQRIGPRNRIRDLVDVFDAFANVAEPL